MDAQETVAELHLMANQELLQMMEQTALPMVVSNEQVEQEEMAALAAEP